MLLPLHILKYVPTHLKSKSRANITVSRRWYAQNLPVVLFPLQARYKLCPYNYSQVWPGPDHIKWGSFGNKGFREQSTTVKAQAPKTWATKAQVQQTETCRRAGVRGTLWICWGGCRFRNWQSRRMLHWPSWQICKKNLAKKINIVYATPTGMRIEFTFYDFTCEIICAKIMWNTWLQEISFHKWIYKWKQGSDTKQFLIFRLQWLFSAAWAQFKSPVRVATSARPCPG